MAGGATAQWGSWRGSPGLSRSGLASAMTFPTWPCLSHWLPWPPGTPRGSRLAFHMEGAPSPSVPPLWDVPLWLSNYIPFTKNNLDLKTGEHIMGEKSEVEKRGQRASKLGLGRRKSLRPPPSTHPHTCQLGSLSICCVGFWSLSCPLFGGGCGG